jgi:tRNA-dihydrouridine synthase A
MMDRTDRHYRYFMRHITKHTLLYTEMITTMSLLYGKRKQLLDFSAVEKPLAVQLGGGDPRALAECARMVADWGYDEVNLNVGCPSDRAQGNQLGVCLMAHPTLVARCVEAMRTVVDLPITVKHRIGIEGMHYADLAHFVRIVAQAGCDRFIVHARKAFLEGLDPRKNRTIPPLCYEEVYRLCADFPELVIEINGGITTLEQVAQHLSYVHGAMIGRAAYDNPYLFASVDALFFGDRTPPLTRRQVLEAMIPYIEHWIAKGINSHTLIRHMLGLFTGQPGTKAWKRYLHTHIQRVRTDATVLLDAIREVPDTVLDAPPTPLFLDSQSFPGVDRRPT